MGKIMKKKIIGIAILFLFGLTLSDNLPSAAAQTRFTSVYTKNISKCGSGATKREEKEMENRGQDIPTECSGPGGYKLFIGYSCCASYFSVIRGDDQINLFTESLDWKQQTAEWRLADGKPFAIIIRYNTHDIDVDTALMTGVKGEFLKVKGLKGFENIDSDIDVRTAKNPNVEARRIADAGFGKVKG